MKSIRFIALFAALAPLVPTAASAFTEDCPFGVNAHQTAAEGLALAADAGIAWVRFDMNWFQFEPSEGNYNWAIADNFVDNATANGQHVFMTVAYTPSWAAGVPCNDADPNPVNWCLNVPPSNPAYWTNFVSAAVNRYGDTVKHWGMWNEPNLGRFYKGTRPQYVDEILIPGSDAVHAACADCQVLGPDLAHLRGADWDSDEGVCVFNECLFNGWNHSLIEILDAASSSIDIITHHKYRDPATDWWAEALDGEFFGMIQTVNSIKEVTDAHGSGQPVWITEFGWETEPWGEYAPGYAANEIASMYTMREDVLAGTLLGATNQPWPELDKLFLYDLVDDPGGYTWGLLDSDLAIKPGYEAYADAIALLGGCEDIVEPPGDDDDDDSGDDDDDDDDGGDDTPDPGDDDATSPDEGDDDGTPDPGDDDATAPDEVDDDDTPVDGDDDDATQPVGDEESDDTATTAAYGCGCSTAPSSPGPLPALMLGLLGATTIRLRRRGQLEQQG